MKIGENKEFFSSASASGDSPCNVFRKTEDSSGKTAASAFFSSAALFDSGIGGLNVLFACRRLMPQQKFIYYGDNLRAPYGNLPEEVIARYVFAAAEELALYRPQALALACNTATACVGGALRKAFSFPVLGAYPPVFSAGRCGGEGLVLVTRATYRSAAFAGLLRRAGKTYPETRFLPYPCDFLAGKVEDTSAAGEDALYTEDLPRRRFSFVALGCTHYAHVKKAIERFYGCPVFDGTENLARRIEHTLAATDDGAGAQADAGTVSTDAFSRPCVTTFAPAVDKYVSADGNVLFLGSGAQKNRAFYEHSFANELS